MSYWDQFNAKSKARLEVGTWPATVRDVEERESRAGNPMVVITLGIHCGGEEHERKTYVPLHVGWRVAQMREAFPRIDRIDDMIGMTCECECIEEDWTNEEGETKTSIKPSNIFPSQNQPAAAEIEDDDDVPF